MNNWLTVLESTDSELQEDYTSVDFDDLESVEFEEGKHEN